MIINKQFDSEKELNTFLIANKVRVINILPKIVTVNNLLATGGTYQPHEAKEVLDVWYEDRRKLVLVTEDGKEIYEGMKCWYYCPETPAGKDILQFRECNGKAVKGKYFSTREVAEKYIIDNQPKASRIIVHEKFSVEYQLNNKIINLQLIPQRNEVDVIVYDVNSGMVNSIIVIPSSKNEITLRF
jgi:hypothetical protein